MNKIILIALFLFWTFPAFSGVLASWDPNPESDLAGYNIYFGTNSGNYDQSIDVGNKTEWFVENLIVPAMYYFAVTAYDMVGNESKFSLEASLLITGIAGSIADVSKECTELFVFNIRGRKLGEHDKVDWSRIASGTYIYMCLIGDDVAWIRKEGLLK